MARLDTFTFRVDEEEKRLIAALLADMSIIIKRPFVLGVNSRFGFGCGQ